MRLRRSVFRVSAGCLLIVAFHPGIRAQCIIPAQIGLNTPDDSQALMLFARVMVDAQTCRPGSASTKAACVARKKELDTLGTEAVALEPAEAYCSAVGKDFAGTTLTKDVKSAYSAHEVFWRSVSDDLAAGSSGSYAVPASLITEYLRMPPLPVAAAPVASIQAPLTPTVSTALLDGMKVFQVEAQKVDPATYPKAPMLKVCIFTTPPTSSKNADCTATGSTVSPANIVGEDGKTVNQVSPANPENAQMTLIEPLAAGEAVYIVESDQDATGKVQNAISAQYLVPARQCNGKFVTEGSHKFSDCDWDFSLIGGIEQSGLASQASQVDGFLRVFTRAGYGNNFQAWAAVRMLGAPSQTSSMGVVAAFSNPTGSITTQSLSSVGYAIDYSVGFETLPWYDWRKNGKPSYTISLIGEYGGTTPLTTGTVAAAYKAPPYGTVECNELYERFQSIFTNDGIALGTTTNAGAASPVCLVNKNTVTSGSTSTVTTYAPIANIGFSNQDRSSFLGKWFFGARSIDRFLPRGAEACGNYDPVNKVAPCARGVVDVLFGADASVNGGYFRPWVFKIDAVHPLLVKSTSYVYIFGSFSVRMKHDRNQSPIVLQAGDISALSGNGSGAVPNVNTVVLPLQQPDRDFYRFGIGLNVSCIFTKLFGNTSSCSDFGGSAGQ